MVVGSLFCICERQRKGNASDNEADLIGSSSKAVEIPGKGKTAEMQKGVENGEESNERKRKRLLVRKNRSKTHYGKRLLTGRNGGS